ncbi:FHA domain-containing protein [Enhygromyxa salina]|uniref:ABC transporter ATP-binding/permease protein n=1 Tax=Enhygromyxa salina TaxID=215803 RepID=A0A2S9YPR4_9BACT|nr:FHA domain-containing protein [Enhygromyxa salina]PRQ07077.1 ABC transporter ATP-binding/permease protein [Enhygromyxa salina]
MSEFVARLIELGEGRNDRAHDLSLGDHVLGRGVGVDVTLDHVDVSRRHAELVVTPDGAMIRDLGSKNGFIVDGRSVSQASLEHGSRVTFGEMRLRFEHHGARVDRLLARSGELTVRRPKPATNPAKLAVKRRPSLLVPIVATLTFTLLLTALLVLG